MVDITNGVTTIKVSDGAFESIYKPQGWYPVENVPKAKTASVKPDETAEQPEPTSEAAEDISETPISEMSFEQLKEYGKALGLDVSEFSNKRLARQKIREALNIEV